MDDISLPVGLEDSVADADIQESVETVEKITDILENGDIELHTAKQLHDHAHDLVSHIETQLDIDGAVSQVGEENTTT